MAKVTDEFLAKRIPSIDRFRGFIVFCMIFFICAAEFPSLGILSRLANNSSTGRVMLFNGMSLADLVDPIFIFLISLSYRGSFKRRYARDGKKAYMHFVTRYMCFMGLGSIMVSVENVFIDKASDPFIVQTILMYGVIAFVALTVVVSLLCKIPRFPKKILPPIKRTLVVLIFILGAIGLVLGINDSISLLFHIENAEIYKHWSILHEIGCTGLLLLPFMKWSTNVRIYAWMAIFYVYTFIQTIPTVIESFDYVVLGGAAGTIGWLLVMLGGVIMMEMFEKGTLHYLVSVLFVLALTLITSTYLPMNTSAVTVNYVLFALLFASLLFYLINFLNNWDPKIKFFTWWGINPLPLFITGLALRGIQKAVDIPDKLWIAILVTFGSAAFLSTIAYILYKKKIILKF